MLYRTCELCGANLDPGEVCDCRSIEKEPPRGNVDGSKDSPMGKGPFVSITDMSAVVNSFDIQAATAAQIRYCDAKHLPFFAPSDGVCGMCHENIYKPLERGGHMSGIDVKTAGEQLITSCPHCEATFCD